MTVEDPILLCPIRFDTANPVLRIDSGTAQDITLTITAGRDYWFSGDLDTRAGYQDLALLLQNALNTNTDGLTFTVSLSDRNTLTIAASGAFDLLWDHANTTLPAAVFGFSGSTASAASTTAPYQTQGSWCPSTSATRPRPPRRDERPQPIVRGYTASAISGLTRAYDLSGTSTLGERRMSWHLIRRSQILTEYAQATEPYGTLEYWWVTAGASSRPIRYYVDNTDRSTYWTGRAKSQRRPWSEDEGRQTLFYLVDLDLREVEGTVNTGSLAVEFDASSSADGVVASTSLFPTTGGFTVAGWFYLNGTAPNSIGGTLNEFVFGYGNPAAGPGSRQIQVHLTPRAGVPTQLFVVVSTDGDTSIAAAVTAPSVGQWVHVMLTVNLTTGAVGWYLNGVLTSNPTLAGAPLTLHTPTSSFYVASRASTGYRDQSVDDLAIWHSVLGLPQAQALFGNTSPLSVGSPAHVWRMGEGGTIASIPDEVGSADMTLNNVSAFVTRL